MFILTMIGFPFHRMKKLKSDDIKSGHAESAVKIDTVRADKLHKNKHGSNTVSTV